MLDRRSPVSLYRQLAHHLLDRIRTGDLPPGSDLPSENTLSSEYGVSRDVVRDAMGVLRTEGIIVTTRGRRSSVRKAIAVEELQAPPAARITVRMPTYDERHRHDMLEGVPLIVIHTDEFETYHPADRVAIITPPGPVQSAGL
ncbi:winged helix-turn-helix domain-containing protein [Dactylosporangium sp. CS-047395]|uniref:winged helix-turn-helix domain-containing protein n=1 Tax=Dactylosporangium sp. CS-047395 TaxID=3239936 RepID=UPI003D8BBB31